MEACKDLDDAVLDAEVVGTYGSIRATLVHIVRAEAGYFGRLTGQAPDRSGWGEVPSMEQIREAARRTGEGLLQEALRPRSSETIRVEWQGEMVEFDTAIILLQAINHGTEHRAHVATILTQNGIAPPEMDGWSYMWTMKEEGGAND
jgi:uncharacterized damage-inducible protein DinB